MFREFLKNTYRDVVNKKVISFINIGGLALGFAALVLILLFVQNQMSYDSWVNDADLIFKVEQEIQYPGRERIDMTHVPPAGIPLLKDRFPSEVEETARLYPANLVVHSQDDVFRENVNFIDPSFLKIFEFPMISGTQGTFDTNYTQMLISEQIAKKYFGDVSSLGKILSVEYGENIDFQIVGVFKDIPENSHLKIDILVPMDPNKFDFMNTNFRGGFTHSYVKFREGTDVKSVEAAMPEFYLDVAPAHPNDPPGGDYRTARKFSFLNIQDVHLFSTKVGHFKTPGDIKVVISFIVIAILILLIAAINFTNLAIANAVSRAREISMRKVLGAGRGQLIRQLLGEANLITFFSLGIGLVLADLILPYYNEFLNLELSIFGGFGFLMFLALFALAGSIGLFGGIYPAFFISKFQPEKVLRANKSSGGSSPRFRQILVTFQFAISIGLIISTVTIYNQNLFLNSLDLGIKKENRVALAGVSSQQSTSRYETLREELLKIPEVTGAGVSSDMFPLIAINNMHFRTSEMEEEVIDTDAIWVDSFVLDVYGVTPIAGRLYSEQFTGDALKIPEDETAPWTRSVIVTESFTRKAGFATAEDAIGKVFAIRNYNNSGHLLLATLVGVVPDLKLRSLHAKTSQIAFFASSQTLDVLTLKIESDDPSAVINKIQETWRRIVPGVPIDLSFVEDNFAALYAKETKTGQVFAAFSLFAIFLACLGLFGLSSFTADQRTKEVGIRKVLGARVSDIVKMFASQITRPVLWANLIAWPVAWYFMTDWLLGFEYRIDLGVTPFLGAGALALLIALTTVSSHAFKMAKTNPIHALQSE